MSRKLEVVTTPGESTLFDSLARLVPENLQAAYYRVLAHTRSLSPDDEMLRILEAMGILTLLTRQLPKEMAEEREIFLEVLTRYEKTSNDTEARMREYLRALEARIQKLPGEIESALNPQELAKLLGESIRQEFLRTTLPETAESLRVTGATIANAQETLTGAFERLSNGRYGVLAQVEYANSYLTNSLESRAMKIDALLLEMRSDILRIWVPILCGSALLIGALVGGGIRGSRDDLEASEPRPSLAVPAEEPLNQTSPSGIEKGAGQSPHREHSSPRPR